MTTTTVSQEAREAYLSMNMLPEFDAADVRAGRWDNTTGLQAFAKFEQSIRQSAERGEAWRPIETAPKDGTRFWGFWPVDVEVGQQQVTYFDQFTLPLPRFCDLADHIDWTQPTAWQPLPSAPERQR